MYIYIYIYFQHPSWLALGAHPASCTMGTGSFPGVKRPGRDVDYPPLSSAEVQERVELYHYSLSGAVWPVVGETYLQIYVHFLPYIQYSQSVIHRRLTTRSTVRAYHMECPLVRRCYNKRLILWLEICESFKSKNYYKRWNTRTSESIYLFNLFYIWVSVHHKSII